MVGPHPDRTDPPNEGRALRAAPDEQHARLAAAVIALVHALDLEADRAMKGDRGLVDRRGDGANHAARGDRLEEALVEQARDAAAALRRVDADEMHIRLVGERLRAETTE